VAFELLLSLAEGDRHGYAILQEVEARTGGRMRLHAGTLYRALGRMVDDGFLTEIEAPAGEDADSRRRVYRLTASGRALARAEASRLQRQVESARARELLEDPASA
jgi:DNA-binding PadR family transcriptional regulator